MLYKYILRFPENFPRQDTSRASHFLTSDSSDRYGEIKAAQGNFGLAEVLDECQCVTWTNQNNLPTPYREREAV